MLQVYGIQGRVCSGTLDQLHAVVTDPLLNLWL